ncbi:MAG: FAD-dependent thymidylate synthase [Spirochaetales bacterium]|nr:FAD-dependent thymidylate synthase [Spirochaetales bacterium]
MRVTLIDSTRNPFDVSIASARTCYSSRGIVWPQDVSATEEARALRDRIAQSTLKAGHLTTRQHPQFIFAIEGVSRQMVWSFLHSHPYYNSEQVSQRYVAVKTEHYYTPPGLSSRSKQLYSEAVAFSMHAYEELCLSLRDLAAQEFFRLFPARRAKPDRWQAVIKKKAMEVARYVLPLSTHTYLYHTINGLTLHRYRKLCRAFDVPEETTAVVNAMIEAVEKSDPDYAAEFADPEHLEDTLEYKFFIESYGQLRNNPDAQNFIEEFDRALDGKIVRLYAPMEGSEALLAAAVRTVLGQSQMALSDARAIEMVLSPASNNYLRSTLNESSLSRTTRALYNLHYTFQKKLSHTADSQDQRHRMVPASRPVLMSHYTGKPDYVTPALVRSRPQIEDRYAAIMQEIFARTTAFMDSGGSPEEASYLLPNAFPVRFYESGDLLNLHHKWKTRTCYNAQEEIFQASVEELQQLSAFQPGIARWIKAPCWVRKMAGVTPFCPEGDRYCGVPVWDKDLESYTRLI